MQIEQDAASQNREWRVQRVAWLVYAGVIVAALAGLFGPGPISHSKAATPSGEVEVQYLRYARMGGPGDLRVSAGATLAQQGELQVAVSSRYLEQMNVQNITPQPQQTAVASDAVRFTFGVGGGQGQVQISFSMKPDGMGPMQGWVQVAGSERVSFSQFVYP